VGIEWVGHSTVLVDLDGVRLVTDPLLRKRVAHLRRAVPVDPNAFNGVDAVLISHAHYDHLDLPSLEQLGKKVQVIVPRGLAGLLRRRGFENVLEIEAGESMSVGSVEVRAVHAEHEASRGPFGAAAASLGYVVVGEKSVYFAGDTDLFVEMAELGPIDVALLPIWGWSRNPSLGAGHLDPRKAAEAIALVRPGMVVPIHWGTYFPLPLGLRRVPTFLERPVAEFLAAARELVPDVEIRVLKPGEKIAF
jgi:L-ascorbate metabolism protein UlaG (beta-lactamase superfamily)